MTRATSAIEVREREAKALRLRQAGLNLREIGEALGISESMAHRIYHRALDRITREPGEAQITLEASRLDQLQRAVWDKALGGNLAAVDRALAIGKRRADLLGLDQPAKHDIRASVFTVDAMDARILELEQLLAAEDPDAAASERRRRERDALVERFRAKWSAPGLARRDPLGIVGEGLDLALALLDLSTEEREAAELEIERALMAMHP